MAGQTLVQRLFELDTPAVSDALDQLGLSQFVVFGLHAISVARRVAGPVVTVRLEDADGRIATNHLGITAVEAASPGDIIVVAHNGPENVSGWGGLLSLGAKLRGVTAIVVDGACRDADEMVDLDLPVYARQTTPRTARGRLIEESWNQPVRVGGVSVSPGDYMLADRSGVAFIPLSRAAEVVATAEAIFAREAAMARDMRAGRTLSEAMRDYETLLAPPAS